MTGLVFKYRMFVQARTDLTEDEIKRYQASQGKSRSPMTWPWRDTYEFVYARRRNNAKAFYAALRGIKPPIKVKAEYASGREPKGHRSDEVAMRAWRGFVGLMGSVGEAQDEVRHFRPDSNWESGATACGIRFSETWVSVGKPECPICLAAAVEQHPEMKEYL